MDPKLERQIALYPGFDWAEKAVAYHQRKNALIRLFFRAGAYNYHRDDVNRMVTEMRDMLFAKGRTLPEVGPFDSARIVYAEIIEIIRTPRPVTRWPSLQAMNAAYRSAFGGPAVGLAILPNGSVRHVQPDASGGYELVDYKSLAGARR